MKRSTAFATLSIAALLTSAAVTAAQPADKKPAASPRAQPEAPKAPEKKPAEAQPAKSPEQEAMEKAWMEAMTPGKMHEHLAKACGEWDGKVLTWMAPGPPSESTCVTTITSMMGGRFMRSETKGTMKMGDQSLPFEGFGIYGYNNTTKTFECTWADNLGTMMMNMTGALSADGKTMTWNTKFVDPMTKKESWMREVERETGPDTMTLEFYGPGMDGKEAKMMQIDYKRKPRGAHDPQANPQGH